MESTRISKIERLLQKELGDIFLKQAKGMPGVLISVSAVRISPDLSVAKAYLSIFPSEKGKFNALFYFFNSSSICSI